MKRKLSIHILLVAILLSLFSAVFPLDTSASIQSDAEKFCAAVYKNSRNPNKNVLEGDCVTGYVQSKNVRSGNTSDSRQRICSENNIDKTACELGWNSASLNLTSNDASNAQKYTNACMEYVGNNQAISACKRGVASALSGADDNSVCNSFTNSPRTPAKTACRAGFSSVKSTQASEQSVREESESSEAESSNATEKTLGCDASINPLTWIICPIVEGLAQVVEQIDNLITKTLEVDTSQIFCSNEDNCKAYRAAWANFRNIALGLLIIVGMTILIAQALGMEILDAYVIRKTLPRFIIAAIAITLSWALMEFAVEITNALGYGVRFLIYAPFNNLSTEIDLTFGGSIIATFFTVGALGILGIFGLLSYALTALIAVFVAVLVLVLREIIITAFIILAPIALVMYVLPNTNRVFKFWWSTFIKLLLMFPIIAGLIAAGRVFAAITLNSSSGGPLANFIAFAAYFAPYFMIPFVFSFVGGAIAQIGGFINERSKGLGGGLRSYRGNVAKKNLSDLASGNRLKNENMPVYGAFARTFNRGTRGAASLKHAGYNPRRMRQRMSAARSTMSADRALEALDKNSDLAAIKADDDLVEAALYAGLEQKEGRQGGDAAVRRELQRRGYHNVEQGVALVRAARNSIDTDSFDTAMSIASFGTSSGWTGKYIEDPITGERTMIHSGGLGEGGATGGGAAREAINRVAGGDRQKAIRMLGAARQLAESKGRFDLSGGSFTEDAQMLDESYRGHLDSDTVTQRLIRGALDGTSRAKLFGGHKRNIDAIAPVVKANIDETLGLTPGARPASPEEAIQQLAFLANAHDQAAYNSPESARVLTEQVLSQSVDIAQLSPEMRVALAPALAERNPDGSIMRDTTTGRAVPRSSGQITYSELMDGMKSDTRFGRYRKEWGTGNEAEAAARAREAGTPPAGGGP